MKVATEKYRSADISGNYADFARALGGWGERVTEPGATVPAIQRAIAMTREGPRRCSSSSPSRRWTFRFFMIAG